MSFVKRSIVAVMAMVMVFSAVSVVGAQGPGGDDGPDGERVRAAVRLNQIVVEVAASALDMEPRELWQDVEPGMTLTEVITANGGDVEQVKADATIAATEAIETALSLDRITQEEADRMVENLDEAIDAVLVRERPEPGNRPVGNILADGALLRQISETLDVPARDVVEARQNGQSFAEFVSENGSDPDQIIADTVAAVTEQIEQAVENERISQETADELLANLETRLTEEINSTEPIADLNSRPNRPQNDNGNRPRINFGFEEVIAENLNMTPREFLQALRSGKTPGEIISENGGDPDAIIAILVGLATERINEGVENGVISQEQADNLIENLETTVTDFLNRSFEGQPGRNGRGFGGNGNNDGVLE